MTPRSRLGLLAAILILASVLRFSGLGAGLRHTPFIDEQFFVVNVEGMLDRGDLDHRFQEYPGFFLYLLMPALALVPRPFGPQAYLVARGVVAAFGVATVALVYLLGARLGRVRAGLIAATILAVSPVAVTTAHEVRPDVALGFFAMVALLIFSRMDGHWKRDVLGGIGVGMATAIKFTGVAVALPYVVRRLTLAKNPFRGMVLAGVISFATYAVLSPYSFLHFDDFVAGVVLQKNHHDQVGSAGPQSYGAMVYIYARTILAIGLGMPALLAALWGLVEERRNWRTLAPLVALPVAMIAILATAQIHRNRFVLPAFGAIAVLSGLGIDALWRRSRVLGVATTLIAIGVPLVSAVEAVAAYRRPSTLDRVVDWTAENVPVGARIATTLPQLGFPNGRYELVPVKDWSPAGLRVAAHADEVIAILKDDSVPFPGFVSRFVARPEHPLEGPLLQVLTRAAPEATPSIDLRDAHLNASENLEALSLLTDGDLKTRWDTEGEQRRGMWVEVVLASPRVIDSIELELGERPNRWGRHVAVEVSPDGHTWNRVETLPGRGEVSAQATADRGYGQVLILVTPVLATRIRLMLVDRFDARWGFAEIHIRALGSAP